MGLLIPKTFLKWQEPREATRWRDANEASSALGGVLTWVGSTAVLMVLWAISGRNVNRPPLPLAAGIAVVGGLFFAYGLPRLVRLARPGVFVRDNGIHVVRANTVQVFKYANVARVHFGRPSGAPDLPFLTIELHNGNALHLGIAPEIDPAGLAGVLRDAGVEVAGASAPAGVRT